MKQINIIYLILITLAILIAFSIYGWSVYQEIEIKRLRIELEYCKIDNKYCPPIKVDERSKIRNILFPEL